MVTTQEVLAVVARSPHDWGRERHRWLTEELGRLGAPTSDLVGAAVAAVADPDRNVRVRAVWALSALPGSAATVALLGALGDPARRVREVALKAVSPHHVGEPEVIAAVRSIADDETEITRLRRLAFFVLSSSIVRDELPDVAEETLRSFLDSERFRGQVLVRLCSTSNLSPTSKAILEEFVRTGSKEEAVMATRALCGQRLLRVDGWLPPELRRRVRAQYDAAPDVYHGVPMCWVPSGEADANILEVDGQPPEAT
jgi:hypothetical protein